MDFSEFRKEITPYLVELNIDLTENQIKQFFDYMNLLIEWNKIMNLTSIIEPKDIIIKHFVDSLTIINMIEKKSRIIDVGTGAGFPGIPIKIIYPETEIILLDSLNKRIKFLDEVIKTLKLKKIHTIHGRAEDFGQDVEYREKFDYAVARAVAPLNILLEYLMPFVRVHGECICMKGSNVEEELAASKNSIKTLKGLLTSKNEFFIPHTDIKRTIIDIKKIEHLSKMYPRKAGTPNKDPI